MCHSGFLSSIRSEKRQQSRTIENFHTIFCRVSIYLLNRSEVKTAKHRGSGRRGGMATPGCHLETS
ncbi:hypothetical protein E2C01_081556 [Portunus trituberculatus]|uniref:Uncharacterized protein n=1 Tax=Portunus trituberculatus TaxID=210409 RepID=A0A5B7IQ30_PORTR|nr:hypothetical protein [Portunus trituberculatus]